MTGLETQRYLEPAAARRPDIRSTRDAHPRPRPCRLRSSRTRCPATTCWSRRARTATPWPGGSRSRSPTPTEVNGTRLAAPDRRRPHRCCAQPAGAFSARRPAGRRRRGPDGGPRRRPGHDLGDRPRTARRSRSSSTTAGRSARSRSTSTRAAAASQPTRCGSLRAPAASTWRSTTRVAAPCLSRGRLRDSLCRSWRPRRHSPSRDQSSSPLRPGISDLKIDGRSLNRDPARPARVQLRQRTDLRIGGAGRTDVGSTPAPSPCPRPQRPARSCDSDNVGLGVSADRGAREADVAVPRRHALADAGLGRSRRPATPLDVRRDSAGTPASVDLPAARVRRSWCCRRTSTTAGWPRSAARSWRRSRSTAGSRAGSSPAARPPGPASTTVPRPPSGSRWASARPACCSACWARCCRRAAAPLRRSRFPRSCRAGPGCSTWWWCSPPAVCSSAGTGLAAVAVALVAGVAARRFEGWAALAAAAMLMVGAGLSWDRITQETWANEWRQAWSLAVVACLVAALATGLAIRVTRAAQDPEAGSGRDLRSRPWLRSQVPRLHPSRRTACS